ncbi:MAG TPA: deoxyribose-phosphate aldolase [Candidatus Avacidaminococcus intestinavium]|uniref:Deoxyribose-phosphate aldolase n=1 Tax=Candidatus Avacidaminococcus intestinavium TaxID=2840684 RepID=A0A9D1MPJ1_9FIRM|nr:deoxyribose-phosphate aldolase [Candidatus Avacidaminococcus intestinavium]
MFFPQYIEHTLLKPEATKADIEKLCAEAEQYEFYGVCINPCYISLAKRRLASSTVKVISVVGFPLGATFTEIKSRETQLAIDSGADEIDMVMNIADFKSGEYEKVQKEIAVVVNAAGEKPVKVIIETALLTREEKQKACKIVIAGGAAFVKTSTGFSSHGAVIADIELIKSMVRGSGVGIKAAGGIRDRATIEAMINAGADRIGTSAGVRIMAEDA